MIITPMLLVSARTGKVSKLGTVRIVNDGTGTPTRANYQWDLLSRRGLVIRGGMLRNWPRQARSPLQLLAAVLAKAYPNGGK